MEKYSLKGLLFVTFLLVNSMSSSFADSIEEGKIVYLDMCEECHQLDGTGMNGVTAGDFVNDESILSQTDAELLNTIKVGKGDPVDGMPPNEGELSDQEMKDVLLYIRTSFGKK
ncbi:MAG: cytochrome c [Gammaproteobacteria bacterium]|nr:cytochrome c [Gammaproteobacteria bacterium]